jgi:hypothetical protein
MFDLVIDVAAVAVVPLLMAVLGGILAAKTVDESNKPRFWIAGFWLLFLVGLLVAIVQQRNADKWSKHLDQSMGDTHNELKSTRQDLDKANEALARSLAEQGRLESLVQSEYVVAVASGADQRAMFGILDKWRQNNLNLGLSVQALHSLSNFELKAQVVAFASELRAAEKEYETDQTKRIGSVNALPGLGLSHRQLDSKRGEINSRTVQDTFRMLPQIQHLYFDRILGYEQELIRRTGKSLPAGNNSLNAEWSRAASFSVLGDSASVLEQLAQSLPG